LLITGSLNQGGAEYQLLELAKILIKHGYSVEVFATTDYSYYLPYVIQHNISYSCNSNNGSKLQRLFRAVRQINKKRPDIAISYIKRVSQVAILARIFSGFRFKLIVSERTAKINPLHDLYYFTVTLLANIMTVNSKAKFNYIYRRFPLMRKRLIYIPNIVDVSKYQHLRPYLKKAQVSSFTYIGRISPEKNITNLIRAIKKVLDHGFELSLKLIGEANNQTYLKEVTDLIIELKLNSVVKYHGPSKDIISVYKETGAICLVSFYEGFSNVLAEALACGIPLIASDIEENRYLIEDGINGYLVDPAEPQSIANGIINLLSLSVTEVTGISDNNRKKASDLFKTEKVYEQYKVIFEDLIHN
jgi:glycosyltransferase involved in cell wall biosynthesis